ncbi:MULTISPECIES: cytochrome c biogenesis CcdA family protein [Prauserella]|uniref:Cytochrome C biogenesis protein ResC n=2 Tax=Prauserella TaxID=142577 RepID=A0A318LXP9_9PSEU|nr:MULTISPECIES: cytochrome c biogenesis CcdA family protein [Prauserella]PXY17559.1 cytochrome C biogenesis protein ResC [Prauserella flavalba]PXY18609.1 cytochrome C biogenesis protein ResC [Prauserella coralliicola]TKG63540.1 cytochrome c biogenesis protein CcdA [Prauserella endophytica]
MSGLTEFVISGPILLAALMAVAAGTVSFASPCCVPLVPGYLAYLAGLAGAGAPSVHESDASHRRGRWRVAGAAFMFVLGFTVVFLAAVVAVVGAADFLLDNEDLLQRIGGVITIGMGLVFLGLVPMLQRDVRLRRLPRGGIAGAPVMGAVYGLGWTPCLGPTLTGVIALASGTQVGSTTARGILLVLAYCLGLGLPFILLALGAQWAVRTTGWLRLHKRKVQLVGGAMLVVVGLLLVTGLWGALVAWLRGPIAGFTTPI